MFFADFTLFPFFRFICAEEKFPPDHVSTTTTLKVKFNILRNHLYCMYCNHMYIL